MTNKQINEMVRCYLSLPYARRIDLAQKLGVDMPYEADHVEWTRKTLEQTKKKGLLQKLWDLARAEKECMP